MSGASSTEIATGAGVLAIAAGFLFFAAQSAGFGTPAGSYELRAAFPSVEGIRPGTDVRLAGVRVGSVVALNLNPQSFLAEARFTVRDDIELPTDSSAVISSEGLLGGNFLELMPGGSSFNLEPGAEIEDTQGAVSIISLMLKFAGGGSSAEDDMAEPQ